jgi:hypothetical protein
LEQIKVVANYWQFHVQSLRNATGPDQRFGRLQKLAQDGFHQHLVSLHSFLNDKNAILAEFILRTGAKPVIWWPAVPGRFAWGAPAAYQAETGQ